MSENRNGRYTGTYDPAHTDTGMHKTRMYRTGTNGKTKGPKRFRPTKEGMLALGELFLIIVIVFLIIFLIIKGITGNKDKDKETTTTYADETTTTKAPEPPKWYDGFSTVSVSSGSAHEGTLVLVNRENTYLFPQSAESRLTSLSGTAGYSNYFVLKYYDLKTNSQITAALCDMTKALCEANPETLGEYTDESGNKVSDRLLISSGYRSFAEQSTLYEKEVSKSGEEIASTFVAEAGKSEHHTGYAVDIKVFTAKKATVDLRPGEYAWMAANAYKYGFIQRYTAEKSELTGYSAENWHFRFVDTPHAEIISSNGWCYEEYTDEIKTHTVDKGPMYFTGKDGIEYMIYYIPADTSSDLTYIPVPEGAKKVSSFYSQKDTQKGMYTVSGDNAGGFIVTVVK